jgi:ceramide glucosyltransferase
VQLAVDTIGEGYAQGKAMLWNYSDMTSEDMLGELSEDVAATKYLNSKNLGVALTELPFEQPIGHKTFKEAMDRQIRWAIIRRHSFPVEYALEIISTGLFWVILASLINWPISDENALVWN